MTGIIDDGMAAAPRAHRAASRIGRVLGLCVLALLAWLAFRGYRQPELILELASFQLC